MKTNPLYPRPACRCSAHSLHIGFEPSRTALLTVRSADEWKTEASAHTSY